MHSDPLVLLHAFPLDSRMWDAIRPVLGDRLITPDLPGFGTAPLPANPPDLNHAAEPGSPGLDRPAEPLADTGSLGLDRAADPGLPDLDRAADLGLPGLDRAAEAVLATLDRLGVERAIVGGCSMGGYVTMALLRRAPSRVSGLILVNTKASADTDAARANRFAMAARAERDASDGLGWLADEMLTSLLGKTTRTRRPAVEATLRALIADQKPAAVAWAQRAMAARVDSFDVLRTAAARQVPALVLRGGEDTMIPGEEASALLTALPHATFVQLPTAGHLAPLETPSELANTLTTWLT